MSELKCPCCGGELVMNEEGDVHHCCGCFFACEPRHLPRITAAMHAQKELDELRESVAWERECRDAYERIVIFQACWEQSHPGFLELDKTRVAASAEVDRLIAATYTKSEVKEE